MVRDRLKGKIAIVTGAGSTAGEGIGNGKASAILYARAGASVMLVDINTTAAELTKEVIDKEGGASFIFQADVSKLGDCKAVASKCIDTYGGIDILHNNVGIGPRTMNGILSLEEEEWDQMIDVNVKSMYLTARTALPNMLMRGNAAILNVSSVAAERFTAGAFHYSISKAAVNALTRSLAIEFADKGVRVNAIMPGLMDTPMVGRYNEFHNIDRDQMKKERAAKVPMKRMGDAWDVARASLFLVSDEASYITGQVLSVDGGYICKS